MPNQKSKTRAPAHLSKESSKWFETVAADFMLEAHHLRLLRLACEAWDRCQGARKVLDQDGLTYTDRFGAPRARPEVSIERDARLAFARLLRELSLDVAAPDEARPTRAGASGRGRR